MKVILRETLNFIGLIAIFIFLYFLWVAVEDGDITALKSAISINLF